MKAALFTKSLLWRQLPSQNPFLWRQLSLQNTVFTKSLLWRQLASQNSFKNPFCEGSSLHKIQFRDGSYSSQNPFCEGIPSPKAFFEGSYLHTIPFCEGSSLHKIFFVKAAPFTRQLPSQNPFCRRQLSSQKPFFNPFCEGLLSFTKYLLWRQLPSQHHFCEGSSLHKIPSVKAALFTKTLF